MMPTEYRPFCTGLSGLIYDRNCRDTTGFFSRDSPKNKLHNDNESIVPRDFFIELCKRKIITSGCNNMHYNSDKHVPMGTIHFNLN